MTSRVVPEAAPGSCIAAAADPQRLGGEKLRPCVEEVGRDTFLVKKSKVMRLFLPCSFNRQLPIILARCNKKYLLESTPEVRSKVVSPGRGLAGEFPSTMTS